MLLSDVTLYLLFATILGLLLNVWRKRQKFVKAINSLPLIPTPSYFFGHLPMLWSLAINPDIDAGSALLSTVEAACLLDPFDKSGITPFWCGPFSIVAVYRPETAEVILSSNVTITKAQQYDFLHPWLGTGLLTSTGDKWKNRRRMLTPAFHFKILEDFIPIMSEQTKVFTDIFETKIKSNGGFISNLSDLILMCALDVICETAMGIKINAQKNPNSDYVSSIHKVGLTFMERVVTPYHYISFIFNLSRVGRRQKHHLAKLHKFTDDVIRKRKAEIMAEISESNHNIPNGQSVPDANDNDDDLYGKKRRKPFMDTLILEHLKDPNNLSELNIREEVDTFMFEGHDTTAWGVTWAIYLTGLNPDVQQKIHDELDSIFGDDKNREITMDDLREMKYIECVVKESQRLYPSVPLYARKVNEEITMNICGEKKIIPSGTQVAIFPTVVHRCPDHWPEPEKFKPERFSPENSKNRHPYSFIPFSAGPRNCIGQKFALLEEKSLMASVFRKFKVTSLDARDKMATVPALILKSKLPIRISVEYRKS